MKTRTLTLILTFVLTWVTMLSHQLTPPEALERLNIHDISTRGNDSPQLIKGITPKDNPDFVSLYIFNTADKSLVVSADDCAIPLLGYFDKLSVDVSPACEEWLSFYAEEIETASKENLIFNNTDYLTTRSARKSINPILETQWGQRNPFNDACPIFDGMKSATGCGATAMAQVMNYHKWPERCQGGVISYNSINGSYETNLTINFDNQILDWNNMLLKYSGETYTQEQAQAVANLMRDCGFALRMNYSPDESGSDEKYLAPALYNFFNYSEVVQMPEHQYYTLAEWEDLVYGQLEKGLPVMYTGQTENNSGHAFVCDGYDGEGYFHINWGWEGLSDGYFLLSALDPAAQGTGGSDSGYNYLQKIVINIVKPGEELPEMADYLIYSKDNFTFKAIGSNPTDESKATVALGSTLEFFPSNGTGIRNNGCQTVTGKFGILIENEKGDTRVSYCNYYISIQPHYYFDSLPVTIPSQLADGSYVVTPIFRLKGDSEYTPIRCPISKVKSLNMEVRSGTATLTVGEKVDDGSGITKIEKGSIRELKYYNLQGHEVRNPRKGEILIRKHGNETNKIIY